uniref:40S ribosomal protein S27 n=1 Tax=Ursus americanus TaxID=9643 RepID=A0A452SH82_URSAM
MAAPLRDAGAARAVAAAAVAAARGLRRPDRACLPLVAREGPPAPVPGRGEEKHKKKRLVQSPNSYFMDVKCPGCYKITTVFSHAQTVVCVFGCSTVLCQPTGEKQGL